MGVRSVPDMFVEHVSVKSLQGPAGTMSDGTRFCDYSLTIDMHKIISAWQSLVTDVQTKLKDDRIKAQDVFDFILGAEIVTVITKEFTAPSPSPRAQKMREEFMLSICRCISQCIDNPTVREGLSKVFSSVWEKPKDTAVEELMAYYNDESFVYAAEIEDMMYIDRFSGENKKIIKKKADEAWEKFSHIGFVSIILHETFDFSEESKKLFSDILAMLTFHAMSYDFCSSIFTGFDDSQIAEV